MLSSWGGHAYPSEVGRAAVHFIIQLSCATWWTLEQKTHFALLSDALERAIESVRGFDRKAQDAMAPAEDDESAYHAHETPSEELFPSEIEPPCIDI